MFSLTPVDRLQEFEAWLKLSATVASPDAREKTMAVFESSTAADFVAPRDRNYPESGLASPDLLDLENLLQNEHLLTQIVLIQIRTRTGPDKSAV